MIKKISYWLQGRNSFSPLRLIIKQPSGFFGTPKLVLIAMAKTAAITITISKIAPLLNLDLTGLAVLS